MSVKKQSVNNIRNIDGPYIHSSMLYKLGLDNTYSSSFNPAPALVVVLLASTEGQ